MTFLDGEMETRESVLVLLKDELLIATLLVGDEEFDDLFWGRKGLKSNSLIRTVTFKTPSLTSFKLSNSSLLNHCLELTLSLLSTVNLSLLSTVLHSFKFQSPNSP